MTRPSLALAALVFAATVPLSACDDDESGTSKPVAVSTQTSESATAPALSASEIAQMAEEVVRSEPGSLTIVAEALADQLGLPSEQVELALAQADIDWNKQALAVARRITTGGHGTTKWLLAKALMSQGGFTKQQANYAVSHIGLDWNKQAVKGVQHILDTGDGWSRSALIRHVMKVDHFTAELADYAVDRVEVDWNKQAVKAAKAYAPATRRGVVRTLTNRGFTTDQAYLAADRLGLYTPGQENALASAEDYLDYTAFSRAGLINQLHSSYGEGYSLADATFAADHVAVDWNRQAYLAAKDYLSYSSFSLSGLINQLESSYGDGFTHEQAVYGATKAYRR